MSPRALATASLALLALLAACADDRKPVDETATPEPVGWGCLDRDGEVVNDPVGAVTSPGTMGSRAMTREFPWPSCKVTVGR